MEVENLQENKLQILGKVTASLIHEIRNPLSAIKLSLEYLQMVQNEFPEDVKETLKSCTDAAERIRCLIENLSTFTRKNFNGNSSCSLNDVTVDAINIMNSTAHARSVLINKKLFAEIPHIYFDRNKLMQVLLNLITNAVEACEGGGNILISTYITGSTGEIIWEIEDDGMGIKEEHKEHILSDFYTSKIKGTGLGLSVCQSILEDHKSRLAFESEPGNGTKFLIYINPGLIQGNHEA